MAEKAFFAVFVIDEDNYTPEPGPVDRHFVISDLAQSNFAEQPGVSNFKVWDSIEDLISEHQRQGPITVDYLKGANPAELGSFAQNPEARSQSPWGYGGHIRADHDAELNLLAAATSSAEHRSLSRRSFRDHVFPVMRDALTFEYYEVRPCIERDRQITSYADEADYAADLVGAQSWGEEFRTFWALYGVGTGIHTAIGDFVSRDAAHEVMNAILAVPAAARNAINDGLPTQCADRSEGEIVAARAADWLDDMINQSSNALRI